MHCSYNEAYTCGCHLQLTIVLLVNILLLLDSVVFTSPSIILS